MFCLFILSLTLFSHEHVVQARSYTSMDSMEHALDDDLLLQLLEGAELSSTHSAFSMQDHEPYRPPIMDGMTPEPQPSSFLGSRVPHSPDRGFSNPVTGNIQHALEGMKSALTCSAQEPSLSLRKRNAQDPPESDPLTKVAKLESVEGIHSTGEQLKDTTSSHHVNQTLLPDAGELYTKTNYPSCILLPSICSMLDNVFNHLVKNPTEIPVIKKYLQQHFFSAKDDTISGLLSSLFTACTPSRMHIEEICRIQMVGELCIALLSRPPLHLEILTELKKHYPNHESAESTHTVWQHLKLAYALRDLRHNLLTHPEETEETTASLLEKLNLLGLPLENALQKAQELLHKKTEKPTPCQPYFSKYVSANIMRFKT